MGGSSAKVSKGQRRIADELLGLIRSGVYGPGEQIPTREALQKQFSASNTTVQRALDRLIAQGFIETRGRNGSTVAMYPPHLFRFGLVFPSHPGSRRGWNRFYETIMQRGRELEGRGGLRFTCFIDVNEGGLTPGGRELANEVATGCLAGLVLVVSPDQLTELLPSLAGVPMVTLVRQTFLAKVPRVHPDRDAFVVRALDWLTERGRKRVAFLTPVRMVQELQDRILAEMMSRGLVYRPHWLQEGSQVSERGVRNVVHLLMHEGQRERPDALLITDDNLVPAACEGLVAAGVRDGSVDVVAHCNWPSPPAHAVPVQLLGYDVAEVMDACLDLLRRQQRGEAVAPITRIAPRFVEERLGSGTQVLEHSR